LLLDTARVLFPAEAYELREILFQQPLRLASGEGQTIQSILTVEDPPNRNDGAPGLSFQVISFPASGVLNEASIVHVTGSLFILDKEQPVSVALDRIRQDCPHAVAHGSWHKRLLESGILLGPSFGWIADLWRGDRASLGRLRPPRCVGDIQRHALHGALLDSCFIVADRGDNRTAVTRLPFSVDALRLYRAALGEEWWCHAQEMENGKFSFQLLDESGAVIADVLGLADKEAPREALFKMSDPPELGRAVLWRGQPANPALRRVKLMRLPREKKLLCETECGLSQVPELAGLEIFGQPIVPISYSVSLLAQMAHHLFPGSAYELNGLVFHKALPVNEGEARTLQASVDLERLDERRSGHHTPGMDFQHISFQPTDEGHRFAETYASGSMAVVDAPQPKFVAIEELLRRCSHSVAFGEWYPWVSKKGYGVGPAYYEWMSGLWRGEEETLTRLRLPGDATIVEGDPLYFALFHGCVMGTNAAFLHEDETVRTPYAIESMRVYGPATGDEWWCYSQRVGPSRYNFQLLNSRGMVLAEITGYTERAVPDGEALFRQADSNQWL
jgi:hypothetical protein